MGAAGHFFLNLFIIAGAIAPFLVAVMLMVYRTRTAQERLIRGLALFTAGLVVLGVNAAGLTVGNAVLDSLEVSGFGGFLLKAMWAVIGGGAGVALSRWLTGHLSASSPVQIRIMVFVGTAAHLELLAIYLSSVHRNGFAVGAGFVPDIFFLAGFLLFIILKYDPEEVRKIRHGLPQRQKAVAPPPHQRAQFVPDEEYLDVFGENS
jgi:hypothetical protein